MMPSVYDVLLGDVTDQDRMAAAARRLRQREALGTLMQMSGDPVLGPMGQEELARVPQTAGRLRTARTAAQQLQQRQQEFQGLEQWRRLQASMEGARTALRQQELAEKITPLGGGYYGQRGDISRTPGWEEQQQRAHERAIELKQAGAYTALQNQMALQNLKESKMSDTMEKEWRQTQSTIFKGRAMLEQAKEIAAKGGAFVEPVADLPSRALGAMGLESLSEMAASAHKTPEEMATRANMADWIADMRKERMGAAVTAYEGAKATPWDPTAGGITQEVALQRWEDLVQAMEYAAAVMAYGKRIPGVKDDPTALPPRPVGMTDEEFAKFNESLQQMMSYGGGFTSGKPATPPTVPTAPTAPTEGFRFE